MDELAVTTPAPEDETSAPEVTTDETTAEAPELTQEEQDALDEEVEFGGNKYRVPKELAPVIAKAANMDADYTRKSQANAEARKALETEREAFLRDQQLSGELRQHESQAMWLEAELKQFHNLDWNNVPPQQKADLLARQMQLQNAHQGIVEQINGKRAEIEARHEHERATVLSQAIEALNKPDPDKGWAGRFDQETRANLTKFGLEVGFSMEQLASATEPLMIKTLNLARIGLESLKKQRAAAAKPAVEAKPVPQVGSNRSAPVVKGLDDRLSAEEWIKRRNAQLKRG